MDFSHNKLRKVFPKGNDCVSKPGTNRREETVISRLYIGRHSCMSQYFFNVFFMKGEESPVYFQCNDLLTYRTYVAVFMFFLSFFLSFFFGGGGGLHL